MKVHLEITSIPMANMQIASITLFWKQNSETDSHYFGIYPLFFDIYFKAKALTLYMYEGTIRSFMHIEVGAFL